MYRGGQLVGTVFHRADGTFAAYWCGLRITTADTHEQALDALLRTVTQ